MARNTEALLRALEALRDDVQGLSARMDRDMAKLGQDMSNRIDNVQRELASQMDKDMAKLNGDVASVQRDVASAKLDAATRMDKLNGDMAKLGQDMSNHLELVKRRVDAIESFPYPTFNRPPQLYGTVAQSVSNPKRVRAGYAG